VAAFIATTQLGIWSSVVAKIIALTIILGPGSPFLNFISSSWWMIFWNLMRERERERGKGERER